MSSSTTTVSAINDAETLFKRASHLHLSAPAPIVPASAVGSRLEQQRIYGGPRLSDRATGGPDAGPLIERFACLFKDQYCCDTNPRGIVSLGVAENFLMADEIIEFFKKAFCANFLQSDLSYGDSLFGSRRLLGALCEFYNEYFKPHEEVVPEQMTTGVGCSAILDQLFFALLDEGEGILVAAPYYTGFDRDIKGRDHANIIPVPVPEGADSFKPSSLLAFEESLKRATSEGIRVRAVIICNPQNPLGRTYPRETLLEYAKFAQKHDLHLISDEIYALSQFTHPAVKDSVPFTSALSLDVEGETGISFDKGRLHVVSGMSKDFCANGLRLGVLITQSHPILLKTLANTSMLMKVSSPADVLWSSLLMDKKYLRWFIETNQQRLGEAYAFVRDWFEKRGVEVADSNAGHFAWVNLGGKLGFSDAVEEKRVFQMLLDNGVYIAPGSAYHAVSAGWYRVTFSVKRNNLLVGLDKIEKLLNLKVEN